MTTNQTASPTRVTIERITDCMAEEFSINLTSASQPGVATANLNGLAVTFAALGGTMIIRAEADTDIPRDDADATWYLAANQVNSISLGASAVVGDHGDTLIGRAEREIAVAAGLTDAQLVDALRVGVDSVLAAHKTFQAVAEQITEQRGAN